MRIWGSWVHPYDQADRWQTVPKHMPGHRSQNASNGLQASCRHRASFLSIGAEEDGQPPPRQPVGCEKKTKPWLSPPGMEPCSPGHRSLLGRSMAMAVPDGERSTVSLSALSKTRLNLSL